MVVAKNINWRHEYILGCVSKQRITFDQLNQTKFVNGFVKGVLDERDEVSGKRCCTVYATSWRTQ